MDDFISAYFNCLQSLPTQMQRFISSYLQSDVNYHHLLNSSMKKASYIKGFNSYCEIDTSLDDLIENLLRMQDICDQRIFEYKELETNFESLTQELVLKRRKLTTLKTNESNGEPADSVKESVCDITQKSENERLTDLTSLLRRMLPSQNSYSGQVKRLNSIKKENMKRSNGDERCSRSPSPPVTRRLIDKTSRKRMYRNELCTRSQKLRNGYEKRISKDRLPSECRSKYSIPRYAASKNASVTKAKLRQTTRSQHIGSSCIRTGFRDVRNRRGARSNNSRISNSRPSSMDRISKQNWLSRHASNDPMKKGRTALVSQKVEDDVSASSKSSDSTMNDRNNRHNSTSGNEECESQSDISMSSRSESQEEDSEIEYESTSALRENGNTRSRNTAEDISRGSRKSITDSTRRYTKRHLVKHDKRRHSPGSQNIPRRLHKSSKIIDDVSNHSASSVSIRNRGIVMRGSRPKVLRSRPRGHRDGSMKLSGPGSDGNESPDEKLYCICKKVSFGDMIACDNDRCKYEWFHFACVDVKFRPKGKWFCPDCRGESKRVKRFDA